MVIGIDSIDSSLLSHNPISFKLGFIMSHKTCIKMLIVVKLHFPDATPYITLHCYCFIIKFDQIDTNNLDK